MRAKYPIYSLARAIHFWMEMKASPGHTKNARPFTYNLCTHWKIEKKNNKVQQALSCSSNYKQRIICKFCWKEWDANGFQSAIYIAQENREKCMTKGKKTGNFEIFCAQFELDTHFSFHWDRVSMNELSRNKLSTNCWVQVM